MSSPKARPLSKSSCVARKSTRSFVSGSAVGCSASAGCCCCSSSPVARRTGRCRGAPTALALSGTSTAEE
eukprot:3937873-Prymnesium_polylepis.1